MRAVSAGTGLLLSYDKQSDYFATKLGQRITKRDPKEAPRIRIRNIGSDGTAAAHGRDDKPGSILEITPEPPYTADAVNPEKTGNAFSTSSSRRTCI